MRVIIQYFIKERMICKNSMLLDNTDDCHFKIVVALWLYRIVKGLQKGVADTAKSLYEMK